MTSRKIDQITDVIVKSNSEKQIILEHMGLTDDMVLDIMKLVKDHHSDATALYWDHNFLEDKGAKLLATALISDDSQKTLPFLKYVHLQFNQIEEEGVKALLALKAIYPDLNFAFCGNPGAKAGMGRTKTPESNPGSYFTGPTP